MPEIKAATPEEIVVQLTSQLQSMQDFANVVVEQRNNALNEVAQLKGQLIRTIQQQQGIQQ